MIATLVVCVLILLGTGVPAAAQATRSVDAPQPAGARTLTGVVVDTTGVPLSGATVYIVELRRTVLSRENGSFRFDDVAAGTYTVGARAIGYISGTGRVVVGANSGAAVIEMTRVTYSLPTMTTSSKRGGLSGVVGDTAYRAMEGVVVKVLGSGAGSAITDARGEFFVPVKPGKYVVKLEKPGFGRQVVGVSVPEEEGRRIAAWLIPEFGRRDPLEGKRLFELEQRLIRRSPVWSKLYAREDFERMNIVDARDAAQRYLAVPLHDDACALINGGPQEAPLWSISAADIEMMEVYGLPPARRARTSINGNSAMVDKGSGRPRCGHVVWLRN